MLPSTIENLDEAVWVEVPKLNGEGNPVARLLLVPYTFDDSLEVFEQFGICTHCSGNGERNEKVCEFCGGKSEHRLTDPPVRTFIIDKHLQGWKDVLVQDVNTGDVREIPYTRQAAAGLAKVLPAFLELLAAASGLGQPRDARKKDSTSPPADGSATEPPQPAEL